MRRAAGQQRLDIDSPWQGAVDAAVPLQPAGDEGIGYRGVSGLQQQLGLQRHGHVLGQLAGAVLDVAGVGEALLQLADEARQARIAVA